MLHFVQYDRFLHVAISPPFPGLLEKTDRKRSLPNVSFRTPRGGEKSLKRCANDVQLWREVNSPRYIEGTRMRIITGISRGVYPANPRPKGVGSENEGLEMTLINSEPFPST